MKQDKSTSDSVQEKKVSKSLKKLFDAPALFDETFMEKFNKIHTMDKILIILAILVIIFTITMIIIYCKFQSVPDTLITCFFAAVVGECGGMSWIKTTKTRVNIKVGTGEQQEEDRN